MPAKTQIAASTTPARKNAATSTRDHLIDIGLQLIRKHGYGATGLQEILNAAVVPKGSFYHHFSSKEEFTAAVLERYVSGAGAHAGRVLGNTRLAPLKRLRRYFEELIPLAGQAAPIQGCLIGSLSLEAAGASPVLQKGVSLGFAQWQEIVAVVLREAVDKGDLPKSTRPDALAGFVLNCWEGALIRSQADRSDTPLKDFVHYMFEEMLGGQLAVNS
ncbi:MAG TPA: TetR family transcriptional regulator C-terminal domain-containing protein [Acidobacteriaceae bacterium]